MRDKENVKQEYIQLGCDIKAEFVAMELMERGLTRDQIVFAPQGTFKRSYVKDIIDFRYIENKENDNLISIMLSREGIYDMLPEGLFHGQGRKKQAQTKEEVIEEIRLHRKEEQAARQFFLPLDNEFTHHRLMMENEERRGAAEFISDRDMEDFFHFSEVFYELNSKQLDYLIQLLPILHDLRGDLAAIRYYFTNMLDEPIIVSRLNYRSRQHLAEQVLSIGEMQIGHNAFLGEWIEDSLPGLLFEIGPLSNNDLAEYMNNGFKARIFNFLCDLLLPAEYEIVQQLTIKDEEKNFVLDDSFKTTLLGYNAYL